MAKENEIPQKKIKTKSIQTKQMDSNHWTSFRNENVMHSKSFNLEDLPTGIKEIKYDYDLLLNNVPTYNAERIRGSPLRKMGRFISLTTREAFAPRAFGKYNKNYVDTKTRIDSLILPDDFPSEHEKRILYISKTDAKVLKIMSDPNRIEIKRKSNKVLPDIVYEDLNETVEKVLVPLKKAKIELDKIIIKILGKNKYSKNQTSSEVNKKMSEPEKSWSKRKSERTPAKLVYDNTGENEKNNSLPVIKETETPKEQDNRTESTVIKNFLPGLKDSEAPKEQDNNAETKVIRNILPAPKDSEAPKEPDTSSDTKVVKNIQPAIKESEAVKEQEFGSEIQRIKNILHALKESDAPKEQDNIAETRVIKNSPSTVIKDSEGPKEQDIGSEIRKIKNTIPPAEQNGGENVEKNSPEPKERDANLFMKAKLEKSGSSKYKVKVLEKSLRSKVVKIKEVLKVKEDAPSTPPAKMDTIADGWVYHWEEVEIPEYEYTYEYQWIDEKEIGKYNAEDIIRIDEPAGEWALGKEGNYTTNKELPTINLLGKLKTNLQNLKAAKAIDTVKGQAKGQGKTQVKTQVKTQLKSPLKSQKKNQIKTKKTTRSPGKMVLPLTTKTPSKNDQTAGKMNPMDIQVNLEKSRIKKLPKYAIEPMDLQVLIEKTRMNRANERPPFEGMSPLDLQVLLEKTQINKANNLPEIEGIDPLELQVLLDKNKVHQEVQLSKIEPIDLQVIIEKAKLNRANERPTFEGFEPMELQILLEKTRVNKAFNLPEIEGVDPIEIQVLLEKTKILKKVSSGKILAAHGQEKSHYDDRGGKHESDAQEEQQDNKIAVKVEHKAEQKVKKIKTPGKKGKLKLAKTPKKEKHLTKVSEKSNLNKTPSQIKRRKSVKIQPSSSKIAKTGSKIKKTGSKLSPGKKMKSAVGRKLKSKSMNEPAKGKTLNSPSRMGKEVSTSKSQVSNRVGKTPKKRQVKKQ